MDVLKDYWAVAVGLVALVVWSVRLEAGMLGNRKDIRRLEEQRKEDARNSESHRDKVDTKLDGIHNSIHEIILLLGKKEDRK